MKIIAKFVAIFVILWGIMNILTAWFYIAWTALEQGSGYILEQMLQNQTSSLQDCQTIQEQLAYLKSHARILALTASFFLLLGPLGVMSGVLLWKRKSPYFSLIICVCGIVGEIIAWTHFQQLGMINWIGLGVLILGILCAVQQLFAYKTSGNLTPSKQKNSDAIPPTNADVLVNTAPQPSVAIQSSTANSCTNFLQKNTKNILVYESH